MTYLITGACGPAGRSLINQLASRGMKVVGCDMAPTARPDGIPIFPIKPANHPEFLAQLQELVAQHEVAVVIPTVSEELPILSAAHLSGVLVASERAVQIANDKLLTTAHLAAAGLAVPHSLPAEKASPEHLAQLGLPVLSKPRVARGGRGVTVHHHSRDLPSEPGMLLSEFIPGAEYCAQVFRQPGQTRVVVLEKTKLRDGRVGNADEVTRTDAPDVAELAFNACAAIGLYGPADLDIRRRADGTPVVLEVNARFGAQSAHAPELLTALLQCYPQES